MFCPQAIEWGGASDWANVGVGLLVAIATFSAVIVALKSSRRAESLARELRKSERQVQIEREDATRGILAISISNELHVLFGEAARIWPRVHEAGRLGAHARQRVHPPQLPDRGFELLERFAPEFILFPADVSHHLLRSLGILMGFRNAPDHWRGIEHAPAMAVALWTLMEHLSLAQEGLLPFVPGGMAAPEIRPMPPIPPE